MIVIAIGLFMGIVIWKPVITLLYDALYMFWWAETFGLKESRRTAWRLVSYAALWFSGGALTTILAAVLI